MIKKYHVKINRMKTFKYFLLLFILQFCLYGQDHRVWTYNSGIYEVNVRQYTSSGTFADFEPNLDRLKQMGIKILWFMPVHPIGVVNRLGTLGSYYSVKDYYGINPEFGTLSDFKSLIDSIHAKGMYILMDWVANHTSWDNNLTVSHPTWYVIENGHFISPPGTGWTDVIQLDYSNDSLRTYMINAMKYWVDNFGVDGFRCDAAGMVPDSFWKQAIDSLKKDRSDLFFLAEGQGNNFFSDGFDMDFAWDLYGFGGGLLPKLYSDPSTNANNLNYYITHNSKSYYDANNYVLNFTSNHDENSWYGSVFSRFGNAAEQYAVLTLTMPGMPLVYSGQEAGMTKSLQFFDKDLIPWKASVMDTIYTKLLNLKSNNSALWNGNAGDWPQRINTSNDIAMYVFMRQKDSSKVLVALNTSGSEQTVTLSGSSFIGTWTNLFTDENVELQSDQSLTFPAYGFKVYKYDNNVTSIDNDKSYPTEFDLLQNFPNPFNPTTKIEYTIPRSASSHVELKVFDVLGNVVATLVNQQQPAGKYDIVFDASKLSSGIYFYRLSAGSYIQVRKMVLLK